MNEWLSIILNHQFIYLPNQLVCALTNCCPNFVQSNMGSFKIKFSNFPKPVPSFGHFGREDDKTMKDHISKLNGIFSLTLEGIKQVQKFAPSSFNSACLEPMETLVSPYSNVLSTACFLVGQVDQMHKSLQRMETKLYSTSLEGKLRALQRHFSNLSNPDVSSQQRVAEIVCAVSQLDEVISIFKCEESIFRMKFYIGACLFTPFCALLKAIFVLAQREPDYSEEGLTYLKQEYQLELDWFSRKCIGARLASCYTTPTITPPGFELTRIADLYDHYLEYNQYYDEAIYDASWQSYGVDLGGKGWRLWHGGGYSWVNLVDPWDLRTSESVDFEPFETDVNTLKTLRRLDLNYVDHAVLKEYRKRVETEMKDFFAEFSLIT